MKYELIVKATNMVIDEYDFKLTVRQIYYRLISPPFQLMSNNLNCYKGFDKILTRAREKLDVDWERIEDRARSIQGGDEGYDTIEEYIETKMDTFTSNNFTMSMWATQPQYVEVWVEKDALASLFLKVAEGFNVIVFPSRGYSSFTKIMEALDRFPEDDKETTILHFADHDPSGLDMTKDIKRRFNEYASDKTINVKRIALNIELVKQLKLEANPVKRADARSAEYLKRFGDKCWELDALPPDHLQRLVRDSIKREIDAEEWNTRDKEIKENRESIDKFLIKASKVVKKLKFKGG